MDKTTKTLLTAILSLPTMSFHEEAISTFVRWYASGLGLDVKEDAAGNILISAGRGLNGVTFAAHMDHPGFEVISSSGKKATVALWGKVEPKTFAGSKVVTYTSTGPTKGRIENKVLATKHLNRFCFTLHSEKNIAIGDFGHYDLPAIKFMGGRIVTRAADNLISVVAILDLMTRLVGGNKNTKVCGLFTRGEEAGFLGAFAAMESHLIPKINPLIVLECSSAKGGAVTIGGGPVVRAGDLQCTYDPEVEVWLSGIGNELKKKDASFVFQRALLQGGRCEACVYVAEGYRTSGLALPLGNYHNQGPKGYAAEFVSIKDYNGMLKFMEELAAHPMPTGVLKKKTSPLWKNYREMEEKLKKSR